MARVFIAGSADGLGMMAGKLLAEQGHGVVLHARNAERRKSVMGKVPGAEDVLIGDLSSVEEAKGLAEKVNALGRFDAVIHNAGVYTASRKVIFAVNSLAPYILTCLIKRPQRLIYLSSGMHTGGSPNLENITKETGCSYSDSKLHVLLLCKAVARKWTDVYANAVNPGWVPTKMGGAGAPDDLEKGFETQAWLAVSEDAGAKVSGRYFFHKKEARYLADADRADLQERFLEISQKASGIAFPQR
jgi:NAD(P)-dependent dehydrogenase (short-subunit alcohol dehydrogenase family)